MTETVGHRLMLRRMRAPPGDEFHYRASVLAGRYWCDEQMKLKILRGISQDDSKKPEKSRKTAAIGTHIHEELYNTGRRHPWEEEWIRLVAPYMTSEWGFMRKFQGIDVYDPITGHPDDFQVTPGKKISIIEYKTTASDSEWWRKFVMATARIQAGVLYPYIIEPLAFRLGYEVADSHAVIFYKQDTRALLEHRTCWYDKGGSEQYLEECFEIIKGERDTYMPKKHKCYMCPLDIMMECRFYKAGRVKPSKKQLKAIAERQAQN